MNEYRVTATTIVAEASVRDMLVRGDATFCLVNADGTAGNRNAHGKHSTWCFRNKGAAYANAARSRNRFVATTAGVVRVEWEKNAVKGETL
jgi:hypothetical protein